ncbi:MAG TPA: hypothetical protein PLI43_07585 [Albidovulum sp.]|uniref:WD40/YVTN/BNR-like repeat-containing protein n=1 Tax=Albidovulum sp. TaxID=1872424 RepID=UPI002C032218|nr:hypothetical protein [Albidovulum sp.]
MMRSSFLIPLIIALAAPPGARAQETARLRDLLGQSHVHGLGFGPGAGAGEPGRLVIATHNGLFAADPISPLAARLGTSGDDFMGWSAAPDQPGVAYASGHPAGGGNLGVIRTTDGGLTWAALSPGAGGPVDFHQMEVSRADPSVLWGVNHGASLQVSRDGGQTWDETGRVPEGVIDIATSPTDPERLFAATRTGLLASADGGASWQTLVSGAPVSLVDFDPDGKLLAFVIGRGLMATSDPAEAGTVEPKWETLSSGPDDDYFLYLAHDPGTPGRMFAATGEGQLVVSSDGGRSWSLMARP